MIEEILDIYSSVSHWLSEREINVNIFAVIIHQGFFMLLREIKVVDNIPYKTVRVTSVEKSFLG